MPYDDLRAFLERLEAEGELARIQVPVDTEHEVGAVTRRALDLGGVERNKGGWIKLPVGKIPLRPGGASLRPISTHCKNAAGRAKVVPGLRSPVQLDQILANQLTSIRWPSNSTFWPGLILHPFRYSAAPSTVTRPFSIAYFAAPPVPQAPDAFRSLWSSM